MASERKFKLFWRVCIVLFLIIVIASFSDLIVKYLWLNGLGYSALFWKIKQTQLLLFFGALVISLLYIGVNIYFIAKRIKPLYFNIGQKPSGLPNIIHIKASKVKSILYGLSIIIGVIFAFGWSFQWNNFFRFAHSQPFGITDPLFDIDTSFYVFILPFIESVQNSLSFLVFFVTAIITFYHLTSGTISLPKWKSIKSQETPNAAHKQVFTNLSVWLLLLGWGYYLERYHLLYKHNEIVYGANYTDIHVLLPVFWIMIVGCLLLAIFAFIQNYKDQRSNFIKAVLSLVLIAIVGQAILPRIIQNVSVDPSEFSLEKPYIKNNIEYTRLAYNLDQVLVKDYNATDTLSLEQINNHQAAIKNIRIWDQNLTIDTYKQLQEIRLYYEFYNIDLDRYHTNKGYRQVLISARELTETLPKKAQTWVNQRLQYTHGYGIVMSPTTQKTNEGSPTFYIKDIPPQSNMGLQVKQPAIYYGETKSGYKLVNTKISELDFPKGDKNVYTHYKGKGGISIDGFFEQLLFAWNFSDFNILLTNYIREGSKIQFWRSVRTRVNKIAPFLTLDNDPYMVLSEGKLYWIQDAYTTASNYPYSEPYDLQYGYNYIRNSVKVVVDAYDGTVNFYVSNPKDPVAKVYQEIFPKMFQPLTAMPETLKQHVKYPKDLFKIQLQKFSIYHMTDPQVFYNQEDLWERPTETYGGQQIKMQPYYLLGILPEDKNLQYMLISPMTPKNRDNMISWMIVKSDYPNYGQIINYELPKEKLFLGPAQIEAKINQNTKISRQLSLWDQRGSKVIRGNLMVIPIENSFLYVEPVFLFSTSINMPQLKRVIATTGTNVVMEPTLNEAIYALYGKTKQPETIEDSAKVSTQKILIKLAPQLEEIKNLWQEMQDAMQNGNWEKFGIKMNEIDGLIKHTK